MDRRRITGPELSVAPYYKKEELDNSIDFNKREDNRNFDQFRLPFIKTNLIPQAKGSCFIESGNTKLICSVYGPRQQKKQLFSSSASLTCELKYASFSKKTRQPHQPTEKQKEVSKIIEQSLSPAIRLDRYPKSTIELFITILQNDGTMSCLANAITAASIALTTAGIEMVDLVIGSSAVFQKDVMLIDGNFKEDDLISDSKMMLAVMPSLNLINHFIVEGLPLDLQLTRSGMHKCLDTCFQQYSLVTQVLTKGLKNKEKDENEMED
ncbi:ribosomal protein S5 domain 2-like protein [Neoconidiobolus thromboides FSU 785]|nr:ribosomal protein S5 domain 2-like protein [Neoconidiobolus thromboides FSU 785]